MNKVDFVSYIKRQFAAALQTLENSITSCPNELWGENADEFAYWYRVYHTLFWTDFYLSDSPDGFSPPVPFTLSEMDPAGVLPDRIYSKDELLGYLEHCKKKLMDKMNNMTNEKFNQKFKSNWMDFTTAELLLYNMRHIQHHAAQLNFILREKTGSAPGWVSGIKVEWIKNV